MSINEIFKLLCKNPDKFIRALLLKYARFVNDQKLLLRLLYKEHIGKSLNLQNPKTFTEKIQWLKLNDHNSRYHIMVDKYEVKKWVAERIGEKYLIPTIGIYNSFDDIDFQSLPNQFVLKNTAGGGGSGVVICNDKRSFDFQRAKRMLQNSMEYDIYKLLGEWAYKGVSTRIIAEEYMTNEGNPLKDYKFFCFNGEPRFLKVDFDRFVDHHANYYDLDWNLLPFGEADLPPVESHIEHCPSNFDKMIAIARKLSNGHPFLRVDLYNISGRILFGELTFYPASGLGVFTPNNWDEKIGTMLEQNAL